MIKPVWDHKKTDGRNPDLRDAWKTIVWGSLKRKDGGHVIREAGSVSVYSLH